MQLLLLVRPVENEKILKYGKKEVKKKTHKEKNEEMAPIKRGSEERRLMPAETETVCTDRRDKQGEKDRQHRYKRVK
jgi:hypothetical protein